MAEKGNPPGSVKELIRAALDIERATADMGAALKLARQALSLAKEQGSPQDLAAAKVTAAHFRFRLGQYEIAEDLANQALELTAAPDDQTAPVHVDALLVLGVCAHESSSLQAAEAYIQRACALAREACEPVYRLRALHNLAGVYTARGQFSLALAADEEACQIAREYGLREWLYYPLMTMAWNLQITGQRRRCRAVLAELEQESEPEGAGRAYADYISAHLEMDENILDEIPERLGRFRTVAERTGDPGMNVEVRLGMARYYRLAGSSALALEWVNDALEFARRVKYSLREADSLAERAKVVWYRGDSSAALEDLASAEAIYAAKGAQYDLAIVALMRASIYHQQNHPEAEQAWLVCANLICAHEYTFLVERGQALIYPLITAYLGSRQKIVAKATAALLEAQRRIPAPPLRVVTLGRFNLWLGDSRKPVEARLLRQRRAGDLLMLLLLNPEHSLSFEQVSEAIWPGRTLAQARTLFHHACHMLRRLLEPDLPEKIDSRYLEVAEGRATLVLPPGSTLDWVEFERCCQREEWDAAARLYQGDFLPALLYSDWTLVYRQHFQKLAQEVMLASAQNRFREGKYRETLEICRRLLEIEPWHEDGVLLGMRAYRELGDKAGALRLYRSLEMALREEVGIEPREELQELYQTIGRWRAPKEAAGRG